MNVLVTGGAGFIGKHVVKCIIEAGHNVSIVDNMTSGRYDNVNPDASFTCMDIRDEQLASVLDKNKPEVVIHLAAQINVQQSLIFPCNDSDINIKGTVSLLEASRKAGVRKIIFASSAAVYGPLQQLPVAETHDLAPLSFYGLSKWSAERYIALFCKLNRMEHTVLRYSNVFGPGQNGEGEGGVISIFLQQLKSNMNPVIFGDGCQTRDFIYVKDVATANLTALNRGDGQILNVSCNRQTSVNELLQTICRMVNKPFRPKHQFARVGDIEHSCLDNGNAKLYLGWHPVYGIEEALRETCAAFN